MRNTINWLAQLLKTGILLYCKQGSEYATIRDVPMPQSNWLQTVLPNSKQLSFEEQIVLVLALLPHISPQTLDVLFMQNKELDRPYTEFGGWRGTSHSGFLPTGQTASFLIENGELKMENELNNNSLSTFDPQFSIYQLLSKNHWFYKENILYIEGQGNGEPFLSGRLVVTDEVLAKVYNQTYEPEYNPSFPAKRITTPLNWGDLVLPYNLREELDDIMCWITHQAEIRSNEQISRIIKQGYRCLFYGPPGTGKTLTAMLLGKQNGLDVYRVDLSIIVSKYIGETEKNLAKVFDKAEHQNWILFFDEADALFGQRTDAQSSNDRHANQEVSYLLQRIEDFSGIVVLASNLKENIDEAFFRRFQSTLYFPMPDERLRYELWQKMLPSEWISNKPDDFLHTAASHKLSGGSMINIIQRCAIKLYGKNMPQLTPDIFKQALLKEQQKEGKMIIK